MGEYTSESPTGDNKQTVHYTDGDTVKLATDLYQYIEHDYKGSPSVDAVRLEAVVQDLRAGKPLQASEWDILNDLRKRLNPEFERWRKGGHDGQASAVPSGGGRIREKASTKAPLEIDRLITVPHLLDGALHDAAHAKLHTDRLADPKVRKDPKAVEFHYDHIVKHLAGNQDHLKRLRDHLSEIPSDPGVFKAEQPALKKQRESSPSPPPNLRESDPHDEASENSRVHPVHECGTCKMFNDGRCWGYGNIRVDEDWVCDSWTVAPNWQAQNAAADQLDLVGMALAAPRMLHEAARSGTDSVANEHPVTVAAPKERQPVVCVDFDGVLHQGPHGLPGHVNGKPVEGAVDGVKKLKDMGYEIIVFTARVDLEAVREWLQSNGFGKLVDEVTNHKPPASAYIDDRATHFTDWKNAVQAVDPLVAVREDPQPFREASVDTLATLSDLGL